jgi:Tfp pilus assembly protein PilN
MIRINLGSGELKKAKKKKLALPFSPAAMDPKALLLIITATAFAFLPYLFFVQYRAVVVADYEKKTNEIQEKIGNMKSEVTKLRSYKTEMESFEQQKKIVSDRLALVRQLLNSRNTPVNVLDTVSQSLSPRTWLQSVDYALLPQPRVSMSGYSFSNEDVSDFVDKLSDSIHLSNVNLEGVDTGPSSAKLEKGGRSFLIVAVPKGVFPATAARNTAGAPGMPGAPGAPAAPTPPDAMLPSTVAGVKK